VRAGLAARDAAGRDAVDPDRAPADGRRAGTVGEVDGRAPVTPRFAGAGTVRVGDEPWDRRFVAGVGACRDTARALLFDIGRSLTCEKRVQYARWTSRADPRRGAS
jgi:hypothetical protein